MPDATPQGDNEPDVAPAAQQIQPTPVDNYPEIAVTPFNHHRSGSPSDFDEETTSIRDPGDDAA